MKWLSVPPDIFLKFPETIQGCGDKKLTWCNVNQFLVCARAKFTVDETNIASRVLTKKD
jgi:hypothetical protein